MRKYFLFLVSWICVNIVLSQRYNIDSLRSQLSQSKSDTNRLHLMSDMAGEYIHFHPDSSYYYGRQEYLLAAQLGNKISEANGLIYMSSGLRQMGNYPKALEYALQSLKLSEQINNQTYIILSVSEISAVYYFEKDGKNCIAYAFRALDLNKTQSVSISQTDLYEQISEAYELMKMHDSSLFYEKKSYETAKKSHDEHLIMFCYENLADEYLELHQDSISLAYYQSAFPYFVHHHIDEGTCEAAHFISEIFERKNRFDSALWYGQLSLRVAQSAMLTSRQSDATDFLVAFYKKKHQPDSALKYLELNVALKDSLFNQEKVQEMENLTFDENVRQQELQEEKKKEQEASVRNLQLIAIAIFIPVFFLFVLFLARIKVRARVVEFLGILSLLLFFEFITDLIYPYVSQFTNENPIWEMLFLVILAALLEPLNFRLEHWVKGYLVHKHVPQPIPVLVEKPPADDEIERNQSLLL